MAGRARRSSPHKTVPTEPVPTWSRLPFDFDCPLELFPSDAEAEAGAEVDGQGGVAYYLVVAAVEGVFDIGIRGDAVVDGVPSADIGADVARGMIDAEAVEVVVRAAADEASA